MYHCGSGVSDGVRETEQRTEGASRPCPISPNEPPPSPTGRDVTLRRTHGQSSLENVVMRSVRSNTAHIFIMPCCDEYSIQCTFLHTIHVHACIYMSHVYTCTFIHVHIHVYM